MCFLLVSKKRCLLNAGAFVRDPVLGFLKRQTTRKPMFGFRDSATNPNGFICLH